MSEKTAGTEHRRADEASGGEDQPGRRAAEVTPPIGEDAVEGQTSHAAPEDDPGVPSDAEIGREEDEARMQGQEREDEETHIEHRGERD